MFTALKKTGKEALVVVDYQVDFVDGTLGFSGAQALEDGICAEIETTRSAGNDVIFTFDTHSESADEYLNTPEGKALPIPHCLRGSDGHALYGKVADCIRPEDARIFKADLWFGSARGALKGARLHEDHVCRTGQQHLRNFQCDSCKNRLPERAGSRTFGSHGFAGRRASQGGA